MTMAVKDNYQLLIEKLDRFTRKYYINQLIRGSLYSVALILALFIVLKLRFCFPETGQFTDAAEDQLAAVWQKVARGDR